MTWIIQKRWSFHDIPTDIPYFLDTKSTTRRARIIDPKGFKVNLLHAGLQKPMEDECFCLGISPRSYAWIREVELNLLSIPVMFARLVVPYFALESAFRRIKYLASQPLGPYLFKLPGITREPFQIKKLRRGEWFYERSRPVEKPAAIWARRSVFRYKASPLLLTEVFLPPYSHIMKGNSSRIYQCKS